ncbi:hypothetical protein SAMN05421820_101840 [Pedobacter steynii]|uniref:Helix-turn-helix domain-containing protein n=1 Tax=Pedobacter steynii TaxID=430522 RepID=A0A1G9LC63_9SPHI|nr:hypothetical protein [Pedobacter steynii]NQX38805.1 hypothetical protein [Pedobacter steynii]SDL59436.1 hypothetical protein SAMN05421820_101840 [Pedobacter steynii]
MKSILRRIEMKIERYFNSRERQMQADHVPLQLDEWFDKLQVMQLLSISASTFYRLEKVSNWKMQQVGKRKYYLKSSILGA